MVNILVFGRSGQVANELSKFIDTTCLDRMMVDLENPKNCAEAVKDHPADAIINAAAYTAVDQAESDEARARLINGEAPKAMAKAAAERGIPFVQISTDYVFNGEGERPWRPDDKTAPQNAYGRSKVLGEKAVTKAGGSHAIMRTSWVFSAHGHNFVKTMLRLGRERDALSIVSDQIGAPTSAKDIADAAREMALQLIDAPEKSGIYHFSSVPDASWADFAREIFAQAGIECEVQDILTKDYPTPAKRPLNSRLDCETTQNIFGIERPDWRVSLADVLAKLAPKAG